MSQEKSAYDYAWTWYKKLRIMKQTWYCHKCGRWCPNCNGRSCDKCCIHGFVGWHHCPYWTGCRCYESGPEQFFEKRTMAVRVPDSARPPRRSRIGPIFGGPPEVVRVDEEGYHMTPIGLTHQDSLFTDCGPALHYCSINPEWHSEAKTAYMCTPKPLNRKAWPWEQNRHLVNTQVPITYKLPVQEWSVGDAGTRTAAGQPAWDYSQEIPPLSYQLFRAYRSAQPQYVLRY